MTDRNSDPASSQQHTLKAETGRFTVTGHDAAGDYILRAGAGDFRFAAQPTVLQIVRVAWEKNWPLIASYALLQIAFAAISYFVESWWAVGLSLFASVASTLLGLFIVTKVITKSGH
jgi:hypothetical protein